MLTTTIAAAAAGEPSRGWGGPIALAIVAAVYITGATLHDVWMRRHDLPSPTGGSDTDGGVNTQVSGGVTADDTGGDTGWWGRIVERDGQRVRAAELARDVDVDVALDDDGGAVETPEDAAARLDRSGVAYAEIVRRLRADHGVSESTAKRAIRRSRESRPTA